MDQRIWDVVTGIGPVVATAIHDGHSVRDELVPLFHISETDRLREEDPFTAEWTTIAPTRVVGLHSRFEVDLNRPRDRAVYRSPADAWGLRVWHKPPSDAVIERSLAGYDAFYEAIDQLLSDVIAEHGASSSSICIHTTIVVVVRTRGRTIQRPTRRSISGHRTSTSVVGAV